MADPARPLIAVLFVAGCGVPTGDVQLTLSVAPGSQSIFEPLALSVRPDPATGELAVLQDDRELVRGPTDAGQLRFTSDGHGYTLALRGVQVDTSCESQTRRGQSTRASDIKCRDDTWLPARLSSDDGPLPGTIPSLRGAAPRQFLATALPWLVPGLLAARIAFAKLWVGLLLAVATLVGGCMFAAHGFDGLFCATYGLAIVVYAALGMYAAIAWQENSRAAGLTLLMGPVAGAVPVALAYPLWDIGGPLVAVAAGLPVLALVMAAVFGLTSLLGDAHPLARWLLASGTSPRERPRKRRKN